MSRVRLPIIWTLASTCAHLICGVEAQCAAFHCTYNLPFGHDRGGPSKAGPAKQSRPAQPSSRSFSSTCAAYIDSMVSFWHVMGLLVRPSLRLVACTKSGMKSSESGRWVLYYHGFESVINMLMWIDCALRYSQINLASDA